MALSRRRWGTSLSKIKVRWTELIIIGKHFLNSGVEGDTEEVDKMCRYEVVLRSMWVFELC